MQLSIVALAKNKGGASQFLQLFTNIIENGITKQNMAPHVQISAQIATREETYKSIGNDTKTRYWRYV